MPVDALDRADRAQEKLTRLRTQYNFGSSTYLGAWSVFGDLQTGVAAEFRVWMGDFGACVRPILPLIKLSIL